MKRKLIQLFNHYFTETLKFNLIIAGTVFSNVPCKQGAFSSTWNITGEKKPTFSSSDKTNILTFLPLHLNFIDIGTSEMQTRHQMHNKLSLSLKSQCNSKLFFPPNHLTSSYVSGLLNKYPSKNSSLHPVHFQVQSWTLCTQGYNRSLSKG